MISPLLTRLVKKRRGPMQKLKPTDALWGIGFFILLGVLVYFAHMADKYN